MRLLRWMLVLAIAAGAIAAALLLLPYGPSQETFVDIASGTGTVEIARQLRTAGIIRSEVAFEVLKAWKGGSLKAGEYRFDHPTGITEVYRRIRSGDVYTLTLVVPEGFNIFDIAAAVAGAGLDSREDFLAAERQHGELIRRWHPGAVSLEGYLFPATYRFSRHATPEQILAAMVRRFGQEIAKLGVATEDVERTVTVASLVEKEVHVDAERPLVAGVFANRIAAGMPLQTDPTVIYGALLRGTWTGAIHESDLRSDSPYNTYTHEGLPPGPVCNPGIPSLQAALHPAHTDFLYFVADGRGGTTRFARGLREHESNVLSYRKSLRP